MGDFHELRLDTRVWDTVQTDRGFAPSVEAIGAGVGGGVYITAGVGTGAAVAGMGAGALDYGGGGDAYAGGAGGMGMVRSSTPRGDPAPGSVMAGARFCHVGIVFEGALYVFGGYDGMYRLNDFVRYRFVVEDKDSQISPSTLVSHSNPLLF